MAKFKENCYYSITSSEKKYLMKNFSIIFALTICFQINTSSLFAQNNKLPVFITDSLDSYIDEVMLQWNIPGLALGIVKNGEVIIEKGYGVCELGHPDKVNEQTLFMIGSNTKAFTGTALAILEYNKECSLNDKVIKWVPKFKMNDPWVTQHATLTDIITHRLGFETFQGDFMYFDSDLTDDEMLQKISLQKPKYGFREKWGYCNAGYFVAGKAIQSISGKAWNDFLQDNIFSSLKMDRTVTSVKQIKDASNASKGHTYINYRMQSIPYGGVDLLGPAASISSCISDMNHWTMALLDSGKFESKTAIPYPAIKRTQEPESIIGNGRHAYNKNLFKLYGLGWQLADYEGVKIVSHTGGIHGYVTSVTLVPELDLGVVVLTNTDQNWAYEGIKWEIVDAFMNLPFRNYCDNWNTYFKKGFKRDSLFVENMKDSILHADKTKLPLKKFTGSFTNNIYGKVQITVEKDHLKMTFEHHPELTAKLNYINDNQFLCTYSNVLYGVKIIPFYFEDKNVKSFTLTVAEQLDFTPYIFIKDETP